MCPKLFDEGMVSTQLKVIGAIPYLKLIQCGYPNNFPREELQMKFDSHLLNHAKMDRSILCRHVLSIHGFKSSDFKLEGTKILFRPGNLNLIQILNRSDEEFVKYTATNVNRRVIQSLWRTILIFLRAYSMCKYRFLKFDQIHSECQI